MKNCIMLSLIFLIITIGIVTADTITVDDSGGQDYTIINDAINNASNGDSILVYSGTYTENVNVNKELTIISEYGNPADTIVQAVDPDSHIFHVTADNVTISGFNITGVTDRRKAGIYLGGVEKCSVTNNSLSNNYCGISLYESSNNSLSNNTAYLNTGTGIFFSHSEYNELSNNNCSKNREGIWIMHSSYNSFSNNNISYNGGGILFSSSTKNYLSNNNFQLNKGNSTLWFKETGIGFYGSSSNNTVINNNASNNGIGITLSYGSGNNVFINNTVNLNDEFGIVLRSSDNNKMINNNANSNRKHGIYLEESNHNTLTNNTANLNRFFGIILFDSSNNILDNNILLDNLKGLHVAVESKDNRISNNEVKDRDVRNILLICFLLTIIVLGIAFVLVREKIVTKKATLSRIYPLAVSLLIIIFELTVYTNESFRTIAGEFWIYFSTVSMFLLPVFSIIYGWISRNKIGSFVVGALPVVGFFSYSWLTSGIVYNIPEIGLIIEIVGYIVSLSVVGGLVGYFASKRELMLAIILGMLWIVIIVSGMD